MLSSARKESAELLANAKADAEKLIDDATKEAKEILGNINRKVTHESLVYEMMQKESTVFKQRLVSMYKEHINLINKLPEIVDEKLDAEAEEEVVEAPVPEFPAAEPAAELPAAPSVEE
jgi:cell division initiation protein